MTFQNWYRKKTEKRKVIYSDFDALIRLIKVQFAFKRINPFWFL